MEPKVINNDPDESYEDRLNEMYDDDKEEDDFLMEGVEPDEENKYLGLAFSRSEEIDEDFDDPVWDASDFVKDENDLP